MSLIIPENIRPDFIAAGWFAGRLVDVPKLEAAEFQLFPLAQQILSELYGLKISTREHGQDCASTALVFDPAIPAELGQAIFSLESKIGAKAYPLAHDDLGYEDFFIGSDGKLYCLSSVTGKFYCVADNFINALENLITGKNSSKEI
jgi:hypothetical protein